MKTHTPKTSFIDPRIRHLVANMNIYGFRTFACCQGHSFPVDKLAPYVAFTSTLAAASELARTLRQDAESSCPSLRWGWEVTASFNNMFRLVFCLRPTNPHRWYDRYRRRSLLLDFNGIIQMLKLTRHS